jgi:hypothetical protein
MESGGSSELDGRTAEGWTFGELGHLIWIIEMRRGSHE